MTTRQVGEFTVTAVSDGVLYSNHDVILGVDKDDSARLTGVPYGQPLPLDVNSFLIRHNGKKVKDEVQHWHVHDCTFQMVYVLNGWAEFEYAGQGVHRIKKGDCINQRPGIPHREIACSDDFEVLEIVAPADFKTRVVEAPPAKQAAE